MPVEPPCGLSQSVLRALPEQAPLHPAVARREVLLIVVASTCAAYAEDAAARLRRDGSVVYIAHSAYGCLRVATSISPDIIVLDPALPRRIEGLLRAHPGSAGAEIVRLQAPRPAVHAPRPLRSPAPTADPHAA